MNTVSLSSLRPGMKCILQELRIFGPLRRRLQELGMLPGEILHISYCAPSGSPMAVLCRGRLLGIRKELCDQLLVTCCA